MYKFPKESAEVLKEKFNGIRVAVIGDMMLDCYFWGNVKRISPEAPVPIIEIDKEIFRFGGAANVATNLVSLGATAYPIGIIGDDEDGERFKSLIDETGLINEGIITDKDRPTTAKTRVIAKTQHVVRIDKESKQNISQVIERKIIRYFAQIVDQLDAVIFQDYNKGVLTKFLIKEITDIANKRGIIITVDPKFNNFFEYINVSVFKPNKKESEDALGLRISNKNDITIIGNQLLKKLNAKNILLTLGSDGVVLFSQSGKELYLPTKARKVSDVSGAGDTVISTLTVALSAGANVRDAAYLSNFAGGLVCEEVGIVPINKNKLFDLVIKENI
jgi:rfaE bifunctional protein kinase chain/domain